MKHVLLALYILAIIACQVYWYKQRKKLPNELKRIDVKTNSIYDLSTLFILFFGYGFLFLYPIQSVFNAYIIIASIIGVIFLSHYVLMMRRYAFPISTKLRFCLLFGVQFYLTITLGFYLIVVYNIR